jgi:hypothetical protein
MVALPTIRNTASYDIVVVTPSGNKHANIQVKTSSKKTTFFPMPSPDKVMAGSRDIYVLVRWIEAEKRFEGFLLTGREAKKSVQETIAWQKQNIRKGTRKDIFPSIDISSKSDTWKKWKKSWEKWTL